MKIFLRLGALLIAAATGIIPAVFAQEKSDNDHTLQAMRDEMARAKARLELKFSGTDEPVRAYYLEYRLLEFDVRGVVGQFRGLITRKTTVNPCMEGRGE